MKKFVMSILTAAVVLLMTVCPKLTACAADSVCISDFCIAVGSSSLDWLEESGFNVIYQNLNPLGGDRVYLGYCLGDSAVTGLMTSPEFQGSVTGAGADYLPVSSVNLNQNAYGSPLYLYYSKDAAAGSGIVSLTFVRETYGEEYGPLDYLNDGSIPVRNEDGTPSDFEAGVSGYNLYCFMVKENVCLPYVSEIRTVEVNRGEDLFLKLASSGCNYYEETPIAEDYDTATYLCCNRTADESEAIRQVFACDTEWNADGEFNYVFAGTYFENGREFTLWYTTEESAGEPAAEISCGKRMADGFVRGDWARAFFEGRATGARTQLYKEDAYRMLIESEEAYDQYQVPVYGLSEENETVGSLTNMYLIRAAGGMEPFVPVLAPAEEKDGDKKEEEKEDGSEEKEEGTEEKEEGTEEKEEGSEETEAVSEETEEMVGETEAESGESEAESGETGRQEEPEENEAAGEDGSPAEEAAGKSAENGYAEDGTLRDEQTEGIEKAEPEEMPETNENANAGSAIGAGKMIMLAVMLFLAAAAVFVFVMVKNRRPKDREKG